MINVILAVDKKGGIGKDGNLPWYIMEELKIFKEKTMNSVLIGGRKTVESLPYLPNRSIFCISRNFKTLNSPKNVVYIFKSINEAIEEVVNFGKKIFIIGGGEIYHQAMEIADRIYLTRIDAVLTGDTYFPVIDDEKWKQTAESSFPKDEKHAYPYHFQVWEKIKTTHH